MDIRFQYVSFSNHSLRSYLSTVLDQNGFDIQTVQTNNWHSFSIGKNPPTRATPLLWYFTGDTY